MLTVRCGCGAVAVIFSIYLNSVLYTQSQETQKDAIQTLFTFNMSLFYKIFTSAFAVAVVVD